MIKKIRRQFIFFTMLVISITIGFLSIIFTLESQDATAYRRTLILAVLIIVTVFIASITLSSIAMRPIKRAWQQQIEFTADASHELRTPLAVIQSSLEILMEDPQATIGQQEKWVNNIHKEMLRINKLVDDLLVLSRADGEETDLVMTDFPLKLVIDEQINIFEAVARKKNVTLICDCTEDIMIHADAQKIAQLFRILIDNSLKYMGKAGAIKVSASMDKKKVRIIYRDNGNGIPAKDVPQIFNRFYRVNKARSRQDGGSGLGLAIAKWIVDAHHGQIEIQSDSNIGVTFLIYI